NGKAFFWLLAALVLAVPAAHGQASLPEFDVDVVGVRGDADPSRTRVDIYTKIPHSNLHFVRTSNGFRAEYQVVADFYEMNGNRRGNRIQSQTWERPVVVEEFARSEERRVGKE